jgi:hypothetical protein
MSAALDACRSAGIFTCYNLLLFEPKATLDDIADNIAFIRRHSDHPVNFCRAEPYYGTPLHRQLQQQGALGGSYLGYDYRIEDDRTELLFRISAAAFRERNFGVSGVHNRYMGLGYMATLLSHFYRDQAPGQVAGLERDARQLTRAIAVESAGFLEKAWELARDADLADHDTITRQTVLLGLEISEADRYQHVKLDTLYDKMEAVARGLEAPKRPRFSRLKQAAAKLARGVAAATLLSAWGVTSATGCDGKRPVASDGGADGKRIPDSDPVPRDQGIETPIADPLPPDQGTDFPIADPPPRDQGVDIPVVDMLPPDMGVDVRVPVDMLPPDQGMDVLIPDPLPQDARAALPFDPAEKAIASASQPRDDGSDSSSYWRDTAPKQAQRSRDLPLFDPPHVSLDAKAIDDGKVAVSVQGLAVAASLRWASDDAIASLAPLPLKANQARELQTDIEDAKEILWTPESETDQLRLCVRTKGGIAIVTLLASEIPELAKARG